MTLMLLAPAIGLMTLLLVALIYRWVGRQTPGTPDMQRIASYIKDGANAFLRREFQTIAYFIVGGAALLLLAMWPRWQIAFGFTVGAVFSLFATVIGMNAATKANVRAINAARTDSGSALTIAFRGGATMGLSIVALELLGIPGLAILFGLKPDAPQTVSLLVGFGFGASLAALFAQVGGGIYTKAADVGADLVGKVEIGIPEDDPRNAAVIADLVGDNVGDCAGRGADLFESGSDNLIAAMIVGVTFIPRYGWAAILLPLLSRAVGAIGAALGTLAVRGSGKKNPAMALNIGAMTTAVFSLLTFYLLGLFVIKDIAIFYCLALGLLAAIAVSAIVQYYTGAALRPVREIAKASQFGSALNILTGLSFGLESTALPIVIISLIMLAAYYIAGAGLNGIYGITAAALGITQMDGIIMAADAFGPIVDNASGIGEMAGLGPEVRRSGDVLDAAGNMAKAVTKGYGMACALMTSAMLLFAYLTELARYEGIVFTNFGDEMVNLMQPVHVAALFIGTTVPFLFSSQAIRAVGLTAHQTVEEVRRQFREIPGLLEGRAAPDYSRCVDISTRNSLRHMIVPTATSIIAPLGIGFILGPRALAAYLIAVTIVGAALASFMFNAGGAWDNAKKSIEDGLYGGKQSEPHKAAVVGDTVGDPLKDTAGPSLHILIKLQNILAITLLPLFLRLNLLGK